MTQIVFFEAFAFNMASGQYDLWMGTATLAEINKRGLKPDLSYPIYENPALAPDGWGCKSAINRY